MCLWFLARDRRNGKFRDRRGEILFIDARKLGTLVDRTHRELSDADIARIADTYHAWRGKDHDDDFDDVTGFCKGTTLEEVRRHSYMLTPGRYVGSELPEDDGEPFEEKMVRLAKEWREQQNEAQMLDDLISKKPRNPWFRNGRKFVTTSSSSGEAWVDLPLSEAVQINPRVGLQRGEVYPFVDMASVDGGQKNVISVGDREFKGSGSRFEHGDTLMARITPCLENGKIARYEAPSGQQQAHGSTEFIVLRGRPGTTTDDFAYYLTQWEDVRQYAIGQMTGTSGRQRVPVDSLDHLIVQVPPIPVQRSVAHILGALDDKIELNRRMNDTLEQMARALYKSLVRGLPPGACQDGRLVGAR